MHTHTRMRTRTCAHTRARGYLEGREQLVVLQGAAAVIVHKVKPLRDDPLHGGVQLVGFDNVAVLVQPAPHVRGLDAAGDLGLHAFCFAHAVRGQADVPARLDCGRCV